MTSDSRVADLSSTEHVNAPSSIDGAGVPDVEPPSTSADGRRPGRPEMRRPAPPRSQVMTRPRVVDTALTVFRAGIGVGGVAILSGVVWRSDAHRTLMDLMATSDASESAKSTLASIAVYGSLVVMALLLLVELIMLSRIAAGRRWPRVFLSFWVPIHLVALVILQAVITGDRWHGVMIQLFLLAQGVLALVGTVMLFSGGVTRWLKQNPVQAGHTAAEEASH